MPAQLGVHRNGQHFCKLTIQERGIIATVEGVHDDQSEAIEQAMYLLRQLAEMAEDAANAMHVDNPST